MKGLVGYIVGGMLFFSILYYIVRCAVEKDGKFNRFTKQGSLKPYFQSYNDLFLYCPDIQAYHNAIEAPNAPNWSVGTGWVNKIRMVSALNPGGYHTCDTLMQVEVHEFTQKYKIHLLYNKYKGICYISIL